MSDIKLILCDIDDTLVHKELHLDEATKEVIKKAQQAGVKFTLATGRMHYRAQVFAEEADLQHHTLPIMEAFSMTEGLLFMRKKCMQVYLRICSANI